MTTKARYDGLADWYDNEFAPDPLAEAKGETLLRLIGPGSGRLLDVGCGTGSYSTGLAELGWDVTGIDVSEDMLRRAREKGIETVRGDADALPFEADTFEAAVSTFTHTDFEDFAVVVREVVRVLKPGAPFVYLGPHPCFVGPHSRFIEGRGVPELHPGYDRPGRYTGGAGFSPTGIRARVGAVHLPLGVLLQAFLNAGLRIEAFEEPVPADRQYPHWLAFRART
jgi:SAM-dependent methyltransferase